MRFTMLAERRNSPSSGRPSTSSRTVCVRFPCATAAIARVTSAVGRSRSSTRVFTETSISPQAPCDSWKRVRSRVLPSLPTAFPTLFNSCAICSLADTISLKVSATFPSSPVHDPGKRTEKSPSRMLCRRERITARLGLSPGVDEPLVFFVPEFGVDSTSEVAVARLWEFLFMSAYSIRSTRSKPSKIDNLFCRNSGERRAGLDPLRQRLKTKVSLDQHLPRIERIRSTVFAVQNASRLQTRMQIKSLRVIGLQPTGSPLQRLGRSGKTASRIVHLGR